MCTIFYRNFFQKAKFRQIFYGGDFLDTRWQDEYNDNNPAKIQGVRGGSLSNQNKGERYAKLQNKSPGALSGFFSGKKVAACMLSVAVAAVIFWGITLTGNTEHSDEQMTVAQALRAAGDTLSANADPTKFTGGISSRVKMMELEEQGQASSDDEAEQEAEDVQALLKEDEEIVTGKFLGASQRGAAPETKTVVEEEDHRLSGAAGARPPCWTPGEQKLIQSGCQRQKDGDL